MSGSTATLKTDRLILRRFYETDAQAMFKNWANDPEVTRFLTWTPHGEEDVTRQVIKSWISGYESEKNYNWAMELVEIGEVIGSISVVSQSDEHSKCEIGYCMSKSWWGKGIMSEALKAVIAHLQNEGFHRIAAKHDTNNPASGKVMQKSGMTFEGILRDYERNSRGEHYSVAIYSTINIKA